MTPAELEIEDSIVAVECIELCQTVDSKLPGVVSILNVSFRDGCLRNAQSMISDVGQVVQAILIVVDDDGVGPRHSCTGTLRLP